MEYIGKLYGKVGRKLVPLMLTSEDVDRLTKERDELAKRIDSMVAEVHAFEKRIVPKIEAFDAKMEQSIKERDTWRSRCRDAQKWLKLSMDGGPITGQGWIDAREACEAGKDE